MQDDGSLDHESPRSVFVTDGYQGLTSPDRSRSSDGSGTSSSGVDHVLADSPVQADDATSAECSGTTHKVPTLLVLQWGHCRNVVASCSRSLICRMLTNLQYAMTAWDTVILLHVCDSQARLCTGKATLHLPTKILHGLQGQMFISAHSVALLQDGGSRTQCHHRAAPLHQQSSG